MGGSTGVERERVQRLGIGPAINAGLRRAMERDDRVLLMGEDIGALGGVFRVTEGLQKDFGEDRVVDTPLAEAGIVGTAIGLALRGYRPVCEIQFNGFVFPAVNQIVTQLAKLRARSRGRIAVPVTLRIPSGGGIGSVEHHSESPEALFAHVPGLRVVTPSTAHDAYWTVQQAIASADPVVFLEPERRYWEKGDVDTGLAPDEVAPLHAARVVRPGTDLTLVAYGQSVRLALDAAAAAAEDGVQLEVVDLRSLSPLDVDTVAESVRRTGRLVVVQEAPVSYGAGAEVAARVQERCFYSLEAPVLRVGGYHLPYPVARVEEHYLPSVDRVLDAVEASLAA